MDDIVIAIVAVGVVLSLFIGVGIFLILRKLSGSQEDMPVAMIKQDLESIRKELGEGMWKTTEISNKQSQESVRLIREITEELTKVGEGQKQVMNVTEQLKGLQDILKNPKQRGVLGEYYLETLLKNVMPPGSYQMQYSFDDGNIVDAAVFVRDKVIPVDSKFSLENYNRIFETEDKAERVRLEKAFISDLKNRISETAKYIRPSEGTTEFAFMFIPHEAIYYDLLVNRISSIGEETENLIQRAAGKYKVIIVSPTSFLAYLQTVLQGLKAMKIEESAQKIQKRVEDLSRHISNHEAYMKKLGVNLGTSVSAYNNAYKELGKIDKDVLRITGSSVDVDVMELQKPDKDED